LESTAPIDLQNVQNNFKILKLSFFFQFCHPPFSNNDNNNNNYKRNNNKKTQVRPDSLSLYINIYINNGKGKGEHTEDTNDASETTNESEADIYKKDEKENILNMHLDFTALYHGAV